MCGVFPEEECFGGGVDCADEAAAGRTQQVQGPELLHRAETDLRVQTEGGRLRSVPDGEDELAVVLHEEVEVVGLVVLVERQRPKKVATRRLLLVPASGERGRIPLREWILRSSSLTTRCDSARRRRMRLL